MAKLRRLNASTLFKCMVVPTMLLCAIFHKPALQWVAFFALLFWFIALLLSPFGGLVERRNRKRMEKKLGQISAAKPEPIKLDPAPMLPENEVFLIRQIHIRITEQLKASYPLVSWIWVKRPSVEEICQGGVWKIVFWLFFFIAILLSFRKRGPIKSPILCDFIGAGSQPFCSIPTSKYSLYSCEYGLKYQSGSMEQIAASLCSSKLAGVILLSVW